MIGNNTDSESSINFKHARRSDFNGQENLVLSHIDYDPYLHPLSSDTQEQSGHTPPDYNTVYPNESTEAPSPAKEESEEVEGMRSHKDDDECSIDPAELEWLIHNAPLIDAEVAKHTNQIQMPLNDELNNNRDHIAVVVHNNTGTNDNNCVTPSKSPAEAPRRSARITNRSGPVATVERYTIAAMRKGLELRAETGTSGKNREQLESMEGPLKDEDWDCVATGAGFIISPSKKAAVGTFIKESARLYA